MYDNGERNRTWFLKIKAIKYLESHRFRILEPEHICKYYNS